MAQLGDIPLPALSNVSIRNVASSLKDIGGRIDRGAAVVANSVPFQYWFGQGSLIDTNINKPFYALNSAIANSPAGDPAVYMSFQQSSPYGAAIGTPLRGLATGSQWLNRLNASVRGITAGESVAGRFGNIAVRNADEAQFIANAEATFGSSSTWTSMTRHLNELIIQRSDIPLSAQNITLMRNGNAPFVRAADGSWQQLQLHHVGRTTGQLIEVQKRHHGYNPASGGQLHIPGPGGPVRQTGYTKSYWMQRYQDYVNSGKIVR